MNKAVLILITFLFVLFSCATTDNKVPLKSVVLSKSDNLKISTSKFIKLFPRNGQIVQTVFYENNGDKKSAQVIFVKKNEFGRESLTVSVLSMFGMEILSLEFDGESISRKAGLPSIELSYFDRVMSDMLMIYASQASLEFAISGKFKIRKEKLKRVVIGKSKVLISIIYSDNKTWPKMVEFKQHELDYSLKIKTVSVKYENLH